jgi:hypothetical protein
MTSTDRQRVREAIDQHARARRQTFVDHGELNVCNGCGGDTDHETRGCKRCFDRKRRDDRRARREAVA